MCCLYIKPNVFYDSTTLQRAIFAFLDLFHSPTSLQTKHQRRGIKNWFSMICMWKMFLPLRAGALYWLDVATIGSTSIIPPFSRVVHTFPSGEGKRVQKTAARKKNSTETWSASQIAPSCPPPPPDGKFMGTSFSNKTSEIYFLLLSPQCKYNVEVRQVRSTTRWLQCLL